MKRNTSSTCLFALWLLISCSSSDKIVPKNNPPIAKIQIVEEINRFTLDGSLSSDPEGDPLTYTWSTSSNLITIVSSSSPKSYFNIPIVSESFSVDVTLEVKDGIRTTQSTQTILVPAITQIEAYGLGETLVKSVSNNTNYNWYFDQGNSGTYSSVNCGPTSVTMAIKWANKHFGKTPLDARNTYRSSGGWWYTDDIINYLNLNSIKNYTINLTDINLLKNKIDDGRIIILCLDMFYVEYQNDDTYHFSKFYEANTQGWGHFIVIKGYTDVDGETFFEAYDPYSFGKTYSDASLKGKDRYYKSANLDAATNIWWDYAIVITTASSIGGRMAADSNAIDPTTIEHKSGR